VTTVRNTNKLVSWCLVEIDLFQF